MGYGKGPTEGGSGGKLGHSSMEHWETTHEVKERARRRRRVQGKNETVRQVSEVEATSFRGVVDSTAARI